MATYRVPFVLSQYGVTEVEAVDADAADGMVEDFTIDELERRATDMELMVG